MGYNDDDFVEAVARRAGYKCEACGRSLKPERETDVVTYVAHSSSSMHLRYGPKVYTSTSAPGKLKSMEGRQISGKIFRIAQWGFSDDAFCLCPTCHRDIHALALKKTKQRIPGYKGRQSAPAILEEVTLDFIFSMSNERS